MRFNEDLAETFRLVAGGAQPESQQHKAAAERMVGHGWLIRDREQRYSATPKGNKAFMSQKMLAQAV